MVVPHDGACGAKKWDALQDFLTRNGMLPHRLPFLRRELGRFEQNGVGNRNLTDVVQQRTLLERAHVRGWEASAARQMARVSLNPERMGKSLVFARIERGDQRLERHVIVRFQ